MSQGNFIYIVPPVVGCRYDSRSDSNRLDPAYLPAGRQESPNVQTTFGYWNLEIGYYLIIGVGGWVMMILVILHIIMLSS